MFLLCVSTGVGANTLDFLGEGGSEYLRTTTLELSNATVTSFGTDFFAGQFGNDICAISSYSCAADLGITFDNEIENLSFSVGGWQLGDFVSESLYDSIGGLITDFNITSNGLFDLSEYSGIKSIFFNDTSFASGVAYGDFQFDEISAVPLPAAAWLFGTALLGLADLRRKKL